MYFFDECRAGALHNPAAIKGTSALISGNSKTSNFRCTANVLFPKQSFQSGKCQPVGWICCCATSADNEPQKKSGIGGVLLWTRVFASRTRHRTLASDWCCRPRLSPPVALAASACTCRWQMWWWRRAGKRPVTSTSASMTAGPPTSATPRAACRQTPKDSQGASRNWPTMWVVVREKDALRLWVWIYC